MINFTEVKIIILAAGKGKRMQSELPKALTPLRDKPFLNHILETLQNLNKDIRPVIVIGYNKEKIVEALGDDYTYAEQKEQLGTGHAVMSAKDAVDDSHKIILVISADQPLVSKETLENILNTHTEKNPTITLATVVVPDFEEWRAGLKNFGRIIRNGNGKIKKIIEAKDTNKEEKNIKELNPALYAFNSKWLWENISKLKNENAQAEYYLTDLVKMACDQNLPIETVELASTLEVLQPNSKDELEVLEKLMS